MNKLDFKQTYTRWLRVWRRGAARRTAMEQAIGGEFEAFGILERELLIQHGLQPDAYVIDVGCGSGRLAKPLSTFLRGRYLGIDVVPGFVDYARSLANRPDWKFEVVDGLAIPEQDQVADLVCFFSVFTHLLHEQSYVYLRDARRVLKPGGRIVFSFLEFSIPNHWDVFDSNIADIGGSKPLNMFLSRDAIEAWAAHLDLRIEAVEDGNKPHIPLPEPVVLDSGQVFETMGYLGQSVCVLSRPRG